MSAGEPRVTLLEAVQASLIAAARHAPGEVAPSVIVWPDADGLTHWLADPQQQPFFDAVRHDQILRQTSE